MAKSITFIHPSERAATIAFNKAKAIKPQIVAGRFRGSYAVILGDGTRVDCANYATAQYYVRVNSK